MRASKLRSHALRVALSKAEYTEIKNTADARGVSMAAIARERLVPRG